MGNEAVLNRLVQLYLEVFAHEGFGEIRIEMRVLKRGQKEVILHCGKQHRFVVDCSDRQPLRWGVWKVAESRPAGATRVQERRVDADRRLQPAAIEFTDRRSRRDRRQR